MKSKDDSLLTIVFTIFLFVLAVILVLYMGLNTFGWIFVMGNTAANVLAWVVILPATIYMTGKLIVIGKRVVTRMIDNS